MMKLWISLDEMIQATRNKQVIFWGCFNLFEKTEKLHKFNIKYLVDSSKDTQGKAAHHGYDVFDPSVLKDIQDKDAHYIIISTTAFYEVVGSLKRFGFESGRHFCVTPVAKNFKAIEDIFGIDRKILFSSNDAVQDASNEGGGLYIYDTFSLTLEKKTSGMIRGFDQNLDHYYAVDALVGVRVFDKDFKEVDRFELPKQCYPHGLIYDRERNVVFISLTLLDAIGVFDAQTHKMVDQIHISDKYQRTKVKHHHVNDLLVRGESLYISMFSSIGGLPQGHYDGAIVEYDLRRGTIVGPVADNLWQPHSIKWLDDQFCFLDSMRGNLRVSLHKVKTHLNGFVRGLDYDGKYFYIGQSIHRYFDRMDGVSDNIAVDSGIFIFDGSSKACRFLHN